MKIITSIIFLFSCIAFAQEKQLLENITIDDNTVLVGMNPHYNKDTIYNKLQFFVKGKAVLESLVPQLTYKETGPNTLEENDFRLLVLQGNEVVKSWIVSPLYGTIRVDGVSYKFNVKRLKELAGQYPFEYRSYEKEFANKQEYDKYVNSLKGTEKNFLFAYAPDFKYEGSFTISFPKNETYPNPKAIQKLLEPQAINIVGRDNFRIHYSLDDYNRKNLNQMTMTIEGSKQLYEKLKVDGLKNKNWTDNKPKGIFFMKK